MPQLERDAEWLRYDADVRVARTRLKHSAMAAISAGERPVPITARSVVVAAGRSRSQLYKAHADLLPLIASAQAALERLVTRRAERAKVAAARPSRTSLEEENRRLRAEVKRREAVDASKIASEMFARMFTRDGERAQVEIAQLKAEIAHKDGQLQHFAGLNAALSTLRPLGPGARTIIDG